MVRKEGKVRGEEIQPCFHSNHTCEPAAVAMETRGGCSEAALSQGRHNFFFFFLQKKYPLIKIKKNNESHPLWDSKALPCKVTKERRGLGYGEEAVGPATSACCRELLSQCFRAKGPRRSP